MAYLAKEQDFNVMGEFADGESAWNGIKELKPQVALLDIRMPGLDGVTITRKIKEEGLPVIPLMLTSYDAQQYVLSSLRAGARGFLLKDAGPELLVQAIHAAAAGDALIAPNVTRRLLATFADRAPAAPVQPIDPLTEREEEVLVLVARGWTNAEIARELYVSLSTVKSHVASLMAKLGARNRVEIAMWAYDTKRT